jgi:hypothetical protein
MTFALLSAIRPTTPKHPAGLPLTSGGWIGFDAAAPCSLLDDCQCGK